MLSLPSAIRRTWLKFVLLFIAAVITFALFSDFGEDMARLELTPTLEVQTLENELAKTKAEDLTSTTMAEPNYSGEDSQGKHWKISAKSATQTGGSKVELVTLDTVTALAEIAKGEKILFSAGRGKFNQNTQQIILENTVKVEAQGYILETDKLSADLKNRTAYSHFEVKITSKKGELFARKLEILHNGTILLLSGGVKGQIYTSNKSQNKGNK